jgi:hypothetical protein
VKPKQGRPASILFAFAGSFNYPVKQSVITCDSLLSLQTLHVVGNFQAPQFIGVQVVPGFVHPAKCSLRTRHQFSKH